MAWRWRIAQKLEICWWKRYLNSQPDKVYLERKKAYWHRILDEAGCVPLVGERVLDAGCGPAGVFTVLENCRVDAVDPLVAQYRETLSVFSDYQYPWTQFFCTKLEDFRVSERYSRVFCFNAINHVEDIRRGMDILADAVAPGGTLILSSDAHRHSILKWLFRLLPGDALHPHQYDRKEYIQFLRERGFRVERELVLRREFIFEYCLWVARRDGDPAQQSGR